MHNILGVLVLIRFEPNIFILVFHVFFRFYYQKFGQLHVLSPCVAECSHFCEPSSPNLSLFWEIHSLKIQKGILRKNQSFIETLLWWLSKDIVFLWLADHGLGVCAALASDWPGISGCLPGGCCCLLKYWWLWSIQLCEHCCWDDWQRRGGLHLFQSHQGRRRSLHLNSATADGVSSYWLRGFIVEWCSGWNCNMWCSSAGQGGWWHFLRC